MTAPRIYLWRAGRLVRVELAPLLAPVLPSGRGCWS